MDAQAEIRLGEGQTTEFKFRVDSQRKIAKTLVAFANSDGGTIYIGVKDNGSIAGVRGEEELFMIEGAADLHTRPPVHFHHEALEIEGKVILAIEIPPSTTRPHEAREEEGASPREWSAYFRQGAANFRANGVLLQLWRTQQLEKSLSETEQRVLRVLKNAESRVSVTQVFKSVGLSMKEVEHALATLIAWEIADFWAGEKGIRFGLIGD